MIHNFEDIKADQENINKKVRMQSAAKQMYTILSNALDSHLCGKYPALDFDEIEKIVNKIEGIK